MNKAPTRYKTVKITMHYVLYRLVCISLTTAVCDKGVLLWFAIKISKAEGRAVFILFKRMG